MVIKCLARGQCHSQWRYQTFSFWGGEGQVGAKTWFVWGPNSCLELFICTCLRSHVARGEGQGFGGCSLTPLVAWLDGRDSNPHLDDWAWAIDWVRWARPLGHGTPQEWCCRQEQNVVQFQQIRCDKTLIWKHSSKCNRMHISHWSSSTCTLNDCPRPCSITSHPNTIFS